MNARIMRQQERKRNNPILIMLLTEVSIDVFLLLQKVFLYCAQSIFVKFDTIIHLDITLS